LKQFAHGLFGRGIPLFEGRIQALVDGQIGFNDPLYFSRFYHRQRDRSPKQARRRSGHGGKNASQWD
jgi:hypothetical protein